MADWAKIKAEYIRGGISTRQLAKKHDVPYSQVNWHCNTERWVELKKQKESKAEQRMVDACATREANEAIKLYEVADMATEVIRRMLENPSELRTADIRSLTGAMRDIAAVKGLQTEAEKREQEARIAKLRKEASMDADETNDELGVIFVPHISEELTPPEDKE